MRSGAKHESLDGSLKLDRAVRMVTPLDDGNAMTVCLSMMVLR